jgi:hypothetical protein
MREHRAGKKFYKQAHSAVIRGRSYEATNSECSVAVSMFLRGRMTASERKRLWSYLLPRLQSSEGRSMMPFCQDSYDETS